MDAAGLRDRAAAEGGELTVSVWRHLTRGLRGLIDRDRADRDIADDVGQYLEEATADFVARGLTPGEAARAARLQAGNPTLFAEQARSYGWERAVQTIASDVRYALRRLRRDRAFAVIAVLTLALGIGASTAIFSAVNPILFTPLPYPDARRIAAVSDSGAGGAPQAVTFGTYREVLLRSRSFDALAAFKLWQPTLIGETEPERLDGQRVSADYFRALGVSPLIGRDFDREDDRVNGPKVMILSDRLWRRRLAADPAIVGRTIVLDDVSHLVVASCRRDSRTRPLHRRSCGHRCNTTPFCGRMHASGATICR
jgi:putative ABC transport system permease protein